MRPFSTLGVKPYLWANAEQRSVLHELFLASSRKHHPDFAVSDEDREIRESMTSQLNADYAVLREPMKLVQLVLENATPKEASSAGAPPPALAQEYFELLDDLDSDAGAVSKSRVHDFLDRVREFKSVAQLSFEQACQRFPFVGVGLSTEIPWTSADLASLQSKLNQLKLANRFFTDVDIKLANFSKAH